MPLGSPERKLALDDATTAWTKPPARLRVAALRARTYPATTPPFDQRAIDAELSPRLKRVAEEIEGDAIGW